jgi:serine/threonine-protein kinase
MADVYRADDLTLTLEVAVKVLFGPLAADPGYVARFRDEARRVAALHHPHLVPVYTYGEIAVDGQRLLYLVMPLLHESLRDRLVREGRLRYDAAAQMVLQVVQGLAAAHEMGLVHRDVKPENVLLDAEGRALLGDFGIARELGVTPRRIATLAGTGLPVGTPEYMAPEQLRGGDVDQRADLYALGAVLYELLTGVVPFTGETPYDVAAKVINAPLVPPSVQVLGVPAALERVVLTAMAHEPSDRYATAADMEQALLQALTELSQGTSAAPITEQSTEIMVAAAGGPPHGSSRLASFGGAGRVAVLQGPGRAPKRRAHALLALALAVALVAAGGGALLVALQSGTFAGTSRVTSSPLGTTGTIKANATSVQPTATSTRDGSPTPSSSPTAGSTQPPGGALDLHGTILSVNTTAGTFSYRLSSGATNTVVTNAKTRFTGSAHRLSHLRPGWRADVTGQYLSDGTFLATQVNSNK